MSTLPSNLQALEKRLQHQFADPQLLVRALTHKSFGAEHNERIEYLGDSVLNLAVAHLLYECLSNLPEGDLSRMRAKLVRQETLHQVAVDLGIPNLMRLGEGEAKSGGQKRPSILADTLEAIVGAVYLDGGFDKASSLVRRLFQDLPIDSSTESISKDPKTELQELMQKRKMQLPIYRVVGTQGAAHKQTFDVECEIPEYQRTERGIGGSRRSGEQAAATAMLAYLKSIHAHR